MGEAEKPLRNWLRSPPRIGVECAQALKVMKFLGMTVVRNNQNHYQASHEALKGHPKYPFGSFTLNCHAHGKQGQAHPMGIKDVLNAARIIEATRQEEQQNNENEAE